MIRTLALAIALLVPASAFGQQNLQIIRQDGTVENIRVNSFDTTPKVLPIRPYGLNLKPANIPERRSVYRPPVQTTYNPGPVTIENPYFVQPAAKPKGSLGYALLMIFKRIFRIP